MANLFEKYLLHPIERPITDADAKVDLIRSADNPIMDFFYESAFYRHDCVICDTIYALPYNELFCFMSTNNNDDVLDATVKMEINGQEIILDRPCYVQVPAYVPHGKIEIFDVKTPVFSYVAGFGREHLSTPEANWIREPEITIDELMHHVKGPDFPTGGLIINKDELKSAYATGKGRARIRGEYTIESDKNGDSIVFTSIPYKVSKEKLTVDLDKLCEDGEINGVKSIRDETTHKGVRFVIELEKGVSSAPIIAKIFKKTQLENTYSINQVALVDKKPRLLNLKQLIEICFKDINSFKKVLANNEYHLDYENSKVQLGPLKLYKDGSLGARTALLKQPYNDDPSTTGILVTSKEDMDEYLKIAEEPIDD